MRLFLATLLIPIFVFSAPQVLAQQIPNNGIDTLSVAVSPNTPGPNTEITLRVQSFVYDLDSANITWRVNNATAQQGVGIVELNTTTGDVGEQLQIVVSVETQNGETANETITLQPAAVDVIWEGNTYTPPFYKGRSLQSPDASVTFVALPHFVNQNGVRIPAADLIYTWRRGTEVLGQQSGTGRQSITITNPGKLRDLSVSVDVRSQDKTIQGIGFATAPVVQPRISFYEKHPLLGVLFTNKFGDTVNLGSSELNVVAEPYFIGTDALSNESLQYTWQVNGDSVTPNTQNRNEITLRPEGVGRGRASISLEVRNVAHILQSGRSAFTALFNTN